MKEENGRTAKLTLGIVCALALLVVFMPSGAFAASFDCAKARTQVEKFICASPSLSELDDALHNAYIAARKAGDADAIGGQQRVWLKERNACATPGCVEELYNRRLKELGEKQSASPNLRQITRPQDKGVLEKIWSGDEILHSGSKVYPPYPDIWGVELPLGVNVFGIYPASNGDILFRAFGKNKTGFEWLKSNSKYVMTGLFSGKQWLVSDKDTMFEIYRKNNGALLPIKKIPCPVPISKSDPDMRNSCYAEIDHAFPNGNRLLYVSTDHEGLYCYRERYFRYLVLLDPNGKVLRQVTPIVVSNNKKITEELGGEPPCDHLPGGKKYKTINIWTMAPEIDSFSALADGSFLLGFNHFLVRFDQNFFSRHPAFGKEVFMVDTNTLEKMGNIHSDSRRTIHENALQVDLKIYEMLTGNSKERR